MTYFLPSDSTINSDVPPAQTSTGVAPQGEMSDLKIFWGPEICRLEYLVHLLDTGRVKDEHWPGNV
jgi:hypothetical protein